MQPAYREKLFRIMKDAWRRVRMVRTSMSKALKAAWKAEKKAQAYADRLRSQAARGVVHLRSVVTSAATNKYGRATPLARFRDREAGRVAASW